MSVVSVSYYFRVVVHVWTRPEVAEEYAPVSARWPSVVILVSGVLALALGFYPTLVFGLGVLGSQNVVATR
jgi:NADH:ubiquinone oxidoreductase subunit 2 (subunit N)